VVCLGPIEYLQRGRIAFAKGSLAGEIRTVAEVAPLGHDL